MRIEKDNGSHSGIMIAVYIPAEVAASLAIEGGEPADDLHVTLAYIPKVGQDAQAFSIVCEAAAIVARSFAKPEAWIGGHGIFNGSPTSDGKDVYWASFNCPALTAVRGELLRMLDAAMVDVSMKHGYTPHVTLKYLDASESAPATPPKTVPFSVPTIAVVSSAFRAEFPFIGDRTLKAALPCIGFHCTGRDDAEILFVVSDDVSPTFEEQLRAQPLVNEDGVAFEKRYLDPLGVKRGDVAIAWCAGGEHAQELAEYVSKNNFSAVITLGDLLVTGTGREYVCLPRFVRDGGVWKNSYAEETSRKLKALRRILDANQASVAPSLRPLLKAARLHDGDGIENAKVARLYKANKPKRIVYGVVLDPYQVDLQGDWIPPKDIAETAREFVKNRGSYISYQHEGMADAQLVESSVEVYPTADDELKAESNLPHRAYRRKYGNDVVHSGAWIIGVQLSPKLWDEYLSGNLNAFSIEGFGTRTPMGAGDMPQVTFVDLEAIG